MSDLSEENPFELGEEFEVVDELPKGPTPEEIQAELAALKAEKEALKTQADSTAALKDAFAGFGTQLERSRAVPQPQPVLQQQPQETPEQFKDRINKSYLEDPHGTLVEFANRYMGGAFSTLAQTTMKMSRKLAIIEAPDKDFISKHMDEIEAEASRIPMEQQLNDPDAYKRAMDTVRARHIEDIMQDKINAAVSAALAAQAQPATPARTPAGASEAASALRAPSSPAGSPSSSSGKTVITKAMIPRIQAQMALEGVPPEKFGDYVEWLKEDGELDKFR